MVLDDAAQAVEGFLEGSVLVLEVVAVVVILVGVAVGLMRFVAAFLRKGVEERGRVTLVEDLILGLDILVAADIIRTVITPTLEQLAPLAAIVVVRIVLTFVLSREMEEARRLAEGDQSRTRSAKSDASME